MSMLKVRLMVDAGDLECVPFMPMDVLSSEGERLGVVKPSIPDCGISNRWHAVFDLNESGSGLRLAQGHGISPKEAIINAIRLTREGIEESRVKLDELEEKILA